MKKQNIEYDLLKLKGDLLNLIMAIKNSSNELGWIITSHSHINYNDIELNNNIKDRTINLSSALCVMYIVVMIESYFPSTYIIDKKTINLWNQIKKQEWITEHELNILKAYKHVRHSFAHSPEGFRARQNKKHFDLIMNSDARLPCISIENSKIKVQTGATIQMEIIVNQIIDNILMKMLKSPMYQELESACKA